MSTDPSFRNEQTTLCLESLAVLVEIFWGPAVSECPEILGNRLVSLSKQSSGHGSSWTDPLGKLCEHVPDNQLERFCHELEAVYVSLFINTREASTVPLYASCHEEGGGLMGRQAAEMQNMLTAAGLAVSGPSNEPPDHLAIQLEYLFFLLQRSLEERREKQSTEIVDFVRSGLLSWVPVFHRELEQRASSAPAEQFYVAASAFLIRLLEQIVSWFSSPD